MKKEKQQSIRLGIDVGGTNTDAVLMSGDRVLACAKTATTKNVDDGIVQATRDVLARGSVVVGDIQAVMIGTTHFINAILERKHLSPVAAVRLCLPAGSLLRPFLGWPDDLKAILGEHYYLLKGGVEVDGREISPLDENEVRQVARDIKAKGIQAIALSAIFSHVDDTMERRAAKIIQEEYPEAALSLSSEIGRLGLLERENAAILNAALMRLAKTVKQSFRDALDRLAITAPFYISQNDGTLMGGDQGMRYPVMTFASGPSNSIRGAAYLANCENGIVVDIGGTTTDIGALIDGFPHASSLDVNIGGVRTNFSMPDVLSLPLGGGSIVRQAPVLSIGPDSVGYQLKEKALIFGGEVLTTTDVAVQHQGLNLGDGSRVTLDSASLESVSETIHQMIEEGIDRMKTKAEPMPVILVGGGAILISKPLAGASKVIVPDYAGVANAVGAAIAEVSGLAESMVQLQQRSRDEALDEIKQKAVEEAVKNGAIRETVKIVSISEISLSYLDGDVVRFSVKAVGRLNIGDVDHAKKN